MRKMSTYALALCLILGTAAVAMAKGTSHTLTARGPITTVNPTDKSFSVKGKSGDETFWVTDKTTIREHGKTITINDLKSGEEVLVAYSKAGTRLEASRVTVESHEASKSKSGSKKG